MAKEECCGTCKYHRILARDQDWICIKEDSENCGLWTDYTDYCDEWEEK